MSGINFLSDNHMDDATLSLTTGVENTQYPLVNLQNESPSIRFQGVGATVTIVVDQLTTRAVDTLAVVGSPITGWGTSSVTFKNSTTTDFSLSTAIPITLSSEHNMGIAYITEESGRYWQIELTGVTYAELSNVFIGKRINLAQNNLSIASFKYGYTDKSTIKMNEYGQRFINSRNLVKKISGALQYCTKDETETLDDMFIFHSKTKPLWVIVDKDNGGMNDGEYRLTMYGYINKMPKWSSAGGQLYNTSLETEQAI